MCDRRRMEDLAGMIKAAGIYHGQAIKKDC